jgi:magnesium transporter
MFSIFHDFIKGNDILLHRIKNIKSQRVNYDMDLLEDVEIELRQAQETTNIYSDILTGTMDAYASVISNNKHDEANDFDFHHINDSYCYS